ncbi:MAG: hypothetical protein ABSG68_26935 [Thermoguttaceae bacterium]|jgi:hypothetical protein
MAKKQIDPGPLEHIWRGSEADEAAVRRYAAIKFCERVEVLNRLLLTTEARKAHLSVLLWLHAADAMSVPVEVDAAAIGDSASVRLGQRAVQSAIKFWADLGILILEPRYDRNGRRLPRCARLVWEAVLAVAGQAGAAVHQLPSAGQMVAEDEGRPAVAGPRHLAGQSGRDSARADQYNGPFGAAEEQSFSMPPEGGDLGAQPPDPGAQNLPERGDIGAPVRHPGAHVRQPGAPTCNLSIRKGDTGAQNDLLHVAHAWRSWTRVRAAAHGLQSEESEDVVVDRDQIRRARRTEVRNLAAEAATIVHMRLTDPQVHRTLTADALAALLLFDRAWLIESARKVGAQMRGGDVRKPLGLLQAVLMEATCERGGMEAIAGRAEWKSAFAQVMTPLELHAERHYPPPASPAPPSPPPAERPDTPEEIAELKRAIKEQRDHLRRTAAARPP